MNRCVSIIMSQLLHSTPNPTVATDEEIEDHLAFLFWYLDQELEILSANLYEHVFLRILRQIYIVVLRVCDICYVYKIRFNPLFLYQDIEDVIFPNVIADSNKQEDKALFVEAVLKTV